MKSIPELRRDPLSGDWTIISPGRASRPDLLAQKKTGARRSSPKKECPFENLTSSGNGVVFEAWPDERNWKIAVIPNKYPALVRGAACAVDAREGIYETKTGIGTHELIVTRDHTASFADLRQGLAARVLSVFQDRYRAANDGCNRYATVFLNYGPSVGSSISHPHYQLIAVPFVPPRLKPSLATAERYFKKEGACLRCAMIRAERRHGGRVIGENRRAIAFLPYASRRPFEISVVPKVHDAHFEDAAPETIADVAELLRDALRRLHRYAGDPDLNFFIHSAPYARGGYDGYHWHVEVLPHLSYLGGLEYATGIYINIADPDASASILRGGKPSVRHPIRRKP
jgi:UDPglucose--hexose-1-phosphate uridylyltransferase